MILLASEPLPSSIFHLPSSVPQSSISHPLDSSLSFLSFPSSFRAFCTLIEEEVAINALGGFDRVVATADRVLREHGVEGRLFSERDRNRIRRGRNLVKTRVEFNFDPGKSLRANIEDLLQQAQDVQTHAGGTNYVGAMLQHLVGAKLDLLLAKGKVHHHGFSVADHSTERTGDFNIEGIAVHVTTHPSEALVRKCAQNLRAGLKPVIVTIGEGVGGAAFLLKNVQIADRARPRGPGWCCGHIVRPRPSAGCCGATVASADGRSARDNNGPWHDPSLG